MRDDWPETLLANIAKQAVKDYQAGYHKSGIMRADRWLKLAGLLTDDGLLFDNGTRHTPQTTGVQLTGEAIAEERTRGTGVLPDDIRIQRGVNDGEI